MMTKTIFFLVTLGVVSADEEEPPCRPFKEIYTSGKELCENMWWDSFKYEEDEEKAYTMWFYDHKNNPNDKVTENLQSTGEFGDVPDLALPVEHCYLEYFHKTTENPLDPISNIDHPVQQPDNFQECHPWAERSCCNQETVSSVDKIKHLYGDEWLWDRCGKLSQACERFFVAENCFYECEPNAGLYRKYHNAEGDPNAHHETTSHNPDNEWEMFKMPIKASYCDAWWLACKDDLFCGEDNGNFQSCAKSWKPFDLTPDPVGTVCNGTCVVEGGGSCKDSCKKKSTTGSCYCDKICASKGDCCTDKEAECPSGGGDVAVTGTCDGKCGGKSQETCYCDKACKKQEPSDCCDDFADTCPTHDPENPLCEGSNCNLD